MERSLDTMTKIQNEKEAEIERDGTVPLDSEGIELAEHCNYTIDNPLPLVAKKADPKR